MDSLYAGSDIIRKIQAVETIFHEDGTGWSELFPSLPHLGANFLLEHPVGVCRDLCDFSVYLLRALGIPARIDEVTGKVQLMKDGNASDIDFEATEQVTAPTGKLVLAYTPIKSLSDPKYYSHFTISKIEDARIKLLSYDESDVDMGGGATWNNMFRKGVTMDEGNYVMVSGTRLASGIWPPSKPGLTPPPERAF